MTLSLIVATYNWPQALTLCLSSIARQSRVPDEVIVADDGSGPETRAAIDALVPAFPVPLRHVWQEDLGFRVGRVRNRAIASSAADYILMIDGDLVLHREFVADHLRFAERGWFLQGGRLRASQRESERLFAGGRPRFHFGIDGDFITTYDFKRKHAIRWMWLARRRAYSGRKARIMGCNQSVWRDDLVRVNGFDDEMVGYGSEDLELAERLRNAGIRDRQLKYCALAIHLWHPTRAPEDPDSLEMANNRILLATKTEGRTRCRNGLDAHLDEVAAGRNR